MKPGCAITRFWLVVGAAVVSVPNPVVQAAPSPSREPVPEYAPVAAVLLSADLFEADYHAPELLQAITWAGAEALIALPGPGDGRKLTARLRQSGVSEAALAHTRIVSLPHGNIWMRDYGPLPVFDAQRGLLFLDFRYSDPSSRANDGFPQVAAKALGLPVERVDVELDGGNFLTSGDFCFTSAADLPITRNSNPGAEALPKFGRRLGCRTTVVIRNPPHAHLDMWAKIVDDHTVLVNELDDATLAAAGGQLGQVPDDLKELRDALNSKAEELSRYLKVKRLPMPLPYRGAFRTFANALLVNGHAIVPSYARYGWNYDDYPDAALEQDYEARVRRVYESAGYQVRFINADALVYNGGAFRCVTSPVPETHQSRPKAVKGI